MSRPLSSFGLLVLSLAAAACGSAPDAPATSGSAPGNPGQHAPGTPGTTGPDAIDQLVKAAGNINTHEKPDVTPVKKGTLPDKTYTTPPASTDTTGSKGTEFTCTETQYSLTTVPDTFVALDPNSDVLWPGSLVQGASMASGLLNPVPVPRASGTIVLTIASPSGGPYYATMKEASLSAAVEAQNHILSKYDGATPAAVSFTQSEIFSMDQLEVVVGANAHGSSWSVAANLSFNESDESSRYLIQFTQAYYTMAFQPPEGASGVFAPGVTAEDLKPYLGPGNPPVYVSNVTYGRIFYFLFESTASSEDLAASVQASFQLGGAGGGANGSVDVQKVMQNTTVRMYGIGGNAQEAVQFATGGDPSKPGAGQSMVSLLNDFFVKGASFDAKNLGVPISYTIRYLNDASEVKLALTTEYTAKECAAETLGCDGTAGSGKVLDSCGVCGGDGTSCVCPAQQYTLTASNGEQYAIFQLNQTTSGNSQTFTNDDFGSYAFPLCYHMWWNGLQFDCQGNTWVIDASSVVGSDNNCSADSCGGEVVACGSY